MAEFAPRREWKKRQKHYLKLADELWRASAGLSHGPDDSKFKMIYLVDAIDTDIDHIHMDFIHALKSEELIDAAMLYDALVQFAGWAEYIDSKESRLGRRINVQKILEDDTRYAYDLVYYSEYPTSYIGRSPLMIRGKEKWTTVYSKRPSKILKPLGDVTDRKIWDMRNMLWGLAGLGPSWGVRKDITPLKDRLTYILNEGLASADRAEWSIKDGKFLQSAYWFTKAVFWLDLYFKWREERVELYRSEFEEIDIETWNTFNSIYNHISDLIGWRLTRRELYDWDALQRRLLQAKFVGERYPTYRLEDLAKYKKKKKQKT